MEPIDGFAIMQDNAAFLLFVVVLLGSVFALVHFRRHQRRRIVTGTGAQHDSIREHTMRTLAEKLGLKYQAQDAEALGLDFPDLKLFRQPAEVGLRVQKAADRILGGMPDEVATFHSIRNVVQGIIDDSTLTVLDHHYLASRPKLFQTIVVLRCCRLNVPHITIRPKTKVDGVTAIANPDKLDISASRGFQDHYIVESTHEGYCHSLDEAFVAELARTPHLWIEARQDVVAICRHGRKAQLDEIVALISMAMEFKNSLVHTSSSFPARTYV